MITLNFQFYRAHSSNGNPTAWATRRTTWEEEGDQEVVWKMSKTWQYRQTAGQNRKSTFKHIIEHANSRTRSRFCCFVYKRPWLDFLSHISARRCTNKHLIDSTKTSKRQGPAQLNIWNSFSTFLRIKIIRYESQMENFPSFFQI